MKTDITEKVERFEEIEKKLGIKIEGIYCELEFKDEEYSIRLKGEVVGDSGTINSGLVLKMAVFDDKNRVIAEDSIYIYEDEFVGYDTFSLYVGGLTLKPDRIKLFPKKR